MKFNSKKITCVLAVFIMMFVTGCQNNKIVTKITPQEQKKEYFSSFEDEKRFMLKQAFEAVRKAGETPKAWYSDHANFSKGSDYSSYLGYIECESGKLAHVHIQYKMIDTASLNKKLQEMSDSEIDKVSASKISEVISYKSIPDVYASSANITRNFLNGY